MRTIGIRDALREALHEEMARDESVFVMGEDVIAHGGPYTRHPGNRREVAGSDIRDADRRGRNRRTRSGRGAGRHAPGGRDHVSRLHYLRDGRGGQPGGQDALHDRRPGQRAAGDPSPLRPGPAARGAALADDGVVVHARARTASGGPDHALRRQGTDEDRDPQSRPGGVLRIQGPVPERRRRPRRRLRDPLRRRRRQAGRRGRNGRRHRGDGAARAGGGDRARGRGPRHRGGGSENPLAARRRHHLRIRAQDRTGGGVRDGFVLRRRRRGDRRDACRGVLP